MDIQKIDITSKLLMVNEKPSSIPYHEYKQADFRFFYLVNPIFLMVKAWCCVEGRKPEARCTNTHRLLCAIASYVHLCASAHVCMHHRGTPLTPICLPSSRMIQLQATTSTSCTTSSYTQSFAYARPRDHISYKQRPSGTPFLHATCSLIIKYVLDSPIRKN